MYLLTLLFLLLESIFLYGNLDENTDILIYTTTHYKKIIKSNRFYSNKIIFKIQNTYNTTALACSARFDVFKFPSIAEMKYNKILYLDTDILVTRDLNPIFDLIQEDVIYALQEGTIDSYNGIGWDYWGNILFGNSVNNYIDKSAFSSGIMLFNNCEKIKRVFKQTRKIIKENTDTRICYDQPCIVYCAFINNAYNNKILNNWAKFSESNNLLNIYTDKTLIHYAGGVGLHEHKYRNMSNDLTLYKMVNPISI